jgi:hypothetical protein
MAIFRAFGPYEFKEKHLFENFSAKTEIPKIGTRVSPAPMVSTTWPLSGTTAGQS